MLLKPFLCYATGVLTTALAVSMGCGHWGEICYALGLISALVLAYGLLRRRTVARLAIRVLSRVVGDTPEAPSRSSASKREIQAPENTEIFEAAFMGLRGLGCRPSAARRAAAAAIQQLPCGTEQQVLKLAIQLAR